MQDQKIICQDYNNLKLLHQEIDEASLKLEKMTQNKEQFFNDLYREDQSDKINDIRYKLSEIDLQFIIQTCNDIAKYIGDGQSLDDIDIDFDLVESILKKLFFFQRFTRFTRINIFKLSLLKVVKGNEYVFRQGEIGDSLYVILRGSVNVIVEKSFGVEVIVNNLHDGQRFGENALMTQDEINEEYQLFEEKINKIYIKSVNQVQIRLYGTKEQQAKLNEDEFRQYKLQKQKRTASIQAFETTYLLQILKENFQNILMVVLKDELELKLTMLQQLKFFQGLKPLHLIPIANQMTECLYTLDQVIQKQGDPLIQMYIIYKGSCDVIRQIETQRSMLPIKESLGAIRGSQNFKYDNRKINLVQQHFGSTDNLYDNGAQYKSKIERIKDYDIISNKPQTNQCIYKKMYIYQKLYPGDIIFSRALTGMTLEGHIGQDKARMTIVSSSTNTLLFSISQTQFTYCPEILQNYIINQLKTIEDVDFIQRQPLNKLRKNLQDQLKQKPNMQESERIIIEQEAKKLLELKQQEAIKLAKYKITKKQNELKQDERNKDWESYKNDLLIHSIKDQGEKRGNSYFKKF